MVCLEYTQELIKMKWTKKDQKRLDKRKKNLKKAREKSLLAKNAKRDLFGFVSSVL